jgi:hypothetical protein
LIRYADRKKTNELVIVGNAQQVRHFSPGCDRFGGIGNLPLHPTALISEPDDCNQHVLNGG